MQTITPRDLQRAELIARVRAGDARAVIEQIQALPEGETGQPELRFVRALALAHLGLLEKAVAIWAELFDEGLWSEELVEELAEAHLVLGDAGAAQALLEEWQSSGTALTDKLAGLLAEACLQRRDAEAASRARMLATRHFAHKGLLRRLVRLRASVWQGEWDTLREGAAEDDSTAAAYEPACTLLTDHGHLAEAEELLRVVTERHPEHLQPWLQRVDVTWRSGDEDRAMGLLADAFEIFGEDPALLEKIVRLCIEDRSFELAARWLLRLEAELGEDDETVRALTAEVLIGMGDLQAVATLLDTHDPDDQSLDQARVAYYTRLNRPDEAIAYQDRLLEAQGRSTQALLARARLAVTAGRGGEAVALAEEVLARTPSSLGAIGLLVSQQGRNATLPQLSRLREVMRSGSHLGRSRAWISHALAEYHHAIGDYDVAAGLYAYTNAASEPPEDQRYNRQEHRNWLHELRSAFEALDPAPDRKPGLMQEQPVFIVGVPRSGTTLTEQILGRHPAVTGMGECHHLSASLGWLTRRGTSAEMPVLQALQSCDEQILGELRERFLQVLRSHTQHLGTEGRHCYIDKMPDNYSMIGWIFTLFPDSRVIYARRDPREIALSCWRANFGAIQWAYRLEDIADRIVRHHDIMEFWLHRYADRIFVSDYASLVADPEPHTRRMLAYLDLPWDPACLDHTAAQSMVRTASVQQVRKPVYRSSLAGWRHYEQALSPATRIFEKTGILPQ